MIFVRLRRLVTVPRGQVRTEREDGTRYQRHTQQEKKQVDYVGGSAIECRTVPLDRRSREGTRWRAPRVGVEMKNTDHRRDDNDKNNEESLDDLFQEIWERESRPELRFHISGAGTVRTRTAWTVLLV